MKSSWFVALLILVAVLVCGGCAAVIGNQFAENGKITATVIAPVHLLAMDTAAPEPTATGTATPWPTADYSGLYPTETAVALIRQLGDAQSTQVQNQVITQNLAIQAAQFTETKQASDVATVQAVATEREAIAMTTTPKAQQAVLFAQEIERQDKQTETDANVRLIWNGAGAGVLLIAVFVIAYAVQLGLHNYAQKVYEGREQEPVTEAASGDEFLNNMIPATMITSADESSQFEHGAPITREEWYTLRRAAVALGGLFSRRKLDGSNGGEKYFTDNRAREILAILQAYDADDNRYGQPHTNEMTLLTAHGWAWLKLNPAPSPAEENTKSDENTAKTNPTPPQNTEGEVKSGGEGA